MKKKWMILALMISLILISGSLVGPIMSHVESPPYKVIASEKNIEIRLYQPMIIAEVEVKGARKNAIGEGFRLLADYIFGNNTVEQKISMTAPVQQKSSDDAWKISFVMPSQHTLSSLPKPTNNRVKLEQVPAKKFVAIRFSGTSSDENVTDHEKQLVEYIEARQLQAIGRSKYAFYNPPWTLPFMRRNEVMIEINPGGGPTGPIN